MITEKISTLKIHRLTQEQYERALEEGKIDDTALYLTDDENRNGWYESISLGGTSDNPKVNMTYDETKGRFVISVK